MTSVVDKHAFELQLCSGALIEQLQLQVGSQYKKSDKLCNMLSCSITSAMYPADCKHLLCSPGGLGRGVHRHLWVVEVVPSGAEPPHHF